MLPPPAGAFLLTRALASSILLLAVSSCSNDVRDVVVTDAGEAAAASCGDGICEEDEDCGRCPEDCGLCSPPCGDALCVDAESCESCSSDCGSCAPTCGDSVCSEVEDCSGCPEDCEACPVQCGDGLCAETESCSSCPDDCGACPPTCGDAACNGGESCSSCDTDCGSCGASCGDGTCGSDESCVDCPLDCSACPASCGDGSCDADESCGTCPGDCGVCPAFCGDGSCDLDESCSVCAADCGACAAVCGDLDCNGAENCSICASDCGDCTPTCGDGECDEASETCGDCSDDCGPCEPACGDDLCNGTETCSSCEGDCGACTTVTRTTTNKSAAFVVVWEQNMAKLAMEGWKNFAKCMNEVACAGPKLPDLILANECNLTCAKALVKEINRAVGAAQTPGRRFSFKAHSGKASTAVFWRPKRFTFLEEASVPPWRGMTDFSCCRLVPSQDYACGGVNSGANKVVRLNDTVAGKDLIAISVHFPHNELGGPDTSCSYPGRQYDVSCARKNLTETHKALGAASMKVFGGDFNYKSTCHGEPTGGFKVATDTQSGSFPPRRYREAGGAATAAEHTLHSGIDYIFGRANGEKADMTGYVRVPKEFYCEGAASPSCQWSDHDLRLVEVNW